MARTTSATPMQRGDERLRTTAQAPKTKRVSAGPANAPEHRRRPTAPGEEARRAVPHRARVTPSLRPGSERTDPVELLERQARTRVAELVPIRYGRMLESPFAF